MQIEFLESKDGSKIFSANGMFYHSSYSPVKEAQRFAQTAEFLFPPKIIFFLEPGLSYCTEFFKERFKDCKLVCIRFFNQTFFDENKWDYVIRFEEKLNLSQKLINVFGEDSLISSAFLIWKPAEKLFFNQIEAFIKEYKTALENCKTLLVTRQFFEKKWLINQINFIKYAGHIISAEQQTDKPIVICASGPSLMPCLETIKKYREKLFVLCLSSALSVLIDNSIKPDLILSTDGGYWAGEHLKYLKKHNDIPLAAPCEAFIPKKILVNNRLLALKYNDESSFICCDILEQAKLPSFEAVRNPTVSGTAFYFAKSITTNKIIFCGLDLAPAKGFQHSQTNELELNNQLKDYRIVTKQTRICRSRFNSDSLKIYRNWFSSLEQQDVENVYRVINKAVQEPLGNIKDIEPSEMETLLLNISSNVKAFEFKEINYTKAFKSTADFVIQKLSSDKWKRQIFPADYISIQNSTDETVRSAAENRLNKRVSELIKKIRIIADE